MSAPSCPVSPQHCLVDDGEARADRGSGPEPGRCGGRLGTECTIQTGTWEQRGAAAREPRRTCSWGEAGAQGGRSLERLMSSEHM